MKAPISSFESRVEELIENHVQPRLNERSRRSSLAAFQEMLEEQPDTDPKLRKMPEQKPGRSKQDYGTPADFIAATEKRFGRLTIDLAATPDNAKAPRYVTLEKTPRKGAIVMDSLSAECDWTTLIGDGIGWLNPPFGHIEPWAAKCAAYAKGVGSARAATWRRCLFFLTPASVGANWYASHVHEKALVIFLNGRLSFDGKDPYPKDCMLTAFGAAPGFEVWRWK